MRFQKMSEGNDEDTNTMMFCSSCGTAGGDDIKLTDCDDCDLVKMSEGSQAETRRGVQEASG